MTTPMENEDNMASAEDVAAERPFEEAAAGEDTPAWDGADRSDAPLEDDDARAESAASDEDAPESAECLDGTDELVVVEGGEQVGQTAAESTESEDQPGRRTGARRGAMSDIAARVASHRFSQTVLLRPNSVGRVAILSAVVYVIAVGAAYFFIAQPMKTRLRNVGERMSMLHDVTVIEQSNAALVSFTEGLMTGDQRLTVVSEFGLMAKDAGVRLMGDPELLVPRDVSKLVVEYPARLRVKGTYHGIGTFLSLLESSPRFVQVEEVEIVSDADSRSSESEATVLLALASWGE